MTETPIELDKHRGMAAQKATDIRRVIAEVEANAKLLRDKQGVVESQLLAVPATSWPEAVAKARYLLNLSLFGQSRAKRHASPRPRGRGTCGPYPTLRGRDLNSVPLDE